MTPHLAGDFEGARIALVVQAHDERHGRIEKVKEARRQNGHVDVLPAEGEEECGDALRDDHELVKVGAAYEHLILEEDAGEELDYAVDAEPREHVLERVVEERQLLGEQRLVDYELEGRLRRLLVRHEELERLPRQGRRHVVEEVVHVRLETEAWPGMPRNAPGKQIFR